MATPYAPYPTIKIEPFSSGFVSKVVESLDKINTTAMGQRLLNDLNTLYVPDATIDNARVLIKMPLKDKFVKEHWWSKDKTKVKKVGLAPHEGGNRAVEKSNVRKSNGVGCASIVYFNPYCLVVPGVGKRPIFIALAHELIHSWHYIRGVAKASVGEEEEATVGLGAFALPDPNAITENRFRLEFNLPVRLQY